jgi:serine/threonine-protein kinase
MASPPLPDSPLDAVYCVGCNLKLTLASLCPRCGGTVMFGSSSDAVDPDDDKPDKTEALVGTVLDRYHIELLLGTGGMGRVFLARHRDLLRRCALKILRPNLIGRDSDYVGRFVAEGRAAAALVHPNVVTTHAVGNTDGFHFLEMEFVAGRSLQHHLANSPSPSVSEATELILEITRGLAAAHRAGIVHRDLKPDNVMLTEQGVPKISDFGLAKLIRDQDEARLCGTPHYMAPELFLGQGAHTGSDVYALGVCYYQALCGRLPFTGTDLRNLHHEIATSDPAPVTHPSERVPLEVVSTVAHLLHKSPEHRPADADAVIPLLETVLGAIRNVGALLEEAMGDDGSIAFESVENDSRWILQASQPDGRRQRVFVELSDPDSLVSIYSTCCEAVADFDRTALERNGRMAHGSIAIRPIDGRPHFVVIDTYPRATVDAEELRRSVHEVARQADRVERELTGADIH